MQIVSQKPSCAFERPKLHSTALPLIEELFAELDANEVEYAHWKSNATLHEVVEGQGDLDLLIRPSTAEAFQAVLFDLGFKQIEQPSWARHPSIYHYFGLDQESGKLVHVHVYYRLVTGGVFLKNHHLPLEDAILGEATKRLGVCVPSLAAELSALVLRKMVEAASPLELILLKMDWKHVRSEVDWLLPPGDQQNSATIAESERMAIQALPTLSPQDYRNAVEILQGDTSWLRLFLTGRRVARSLRNYRIESRPISMIKRISRAAIRVVNKLMPGRRPAKRLFTAGKVIAVVGPEASGKSTINGDLTNWLGKVFDLASVHTGKPKSNLITWAPNRLVALTRRFRTDVTKDDVAKDKEAPTRGACDSIQKSENDHSIAIEGASPIANRTGLTLWLYAFRSLWLAQDRRRSVVKAHRMAGRGMVVICDRYPTSVVGAMDSPRLDPESGPIKASRWLTRIAQAEQRIYQSLPQADMIVRLSVPVEVAVQRNRDRVKAGKEGDQFLRLRHAQWVGQKFDCHEQIEIDTSGAIDEVLLEVRRRVWACL